MNEDLYEAFAMAVIGSLVGLLVSVLVLPLPW